MHSRLDCSAVRLSRQLFTGTERTPYEMNSTCVSHPHLSNRRLSSPIIMSRCERDIIRGARAVTSTYFEVCDGLLKFKSAAYIGGDKSPSAPAQETTMRLRVSEEQRKGIAKASTSNNRDSYGICPTAIRDVTLYYDDGSSALCIPIADVIIEYGPVIADWPKLRGSATLCMGIPTRAFASLEKMIFKAFLGSFEEVVIPTLDRSQIGYVWMLASSMSPLAGSYTTEGMTKKIGDIHGLMRILKSNIVADVFVQLNVRQLLNQGENDDVWRLAINVGYVDAIKTTDIRRAKGVVGRGHEASDEIVEATKAMEIEKKQNLAKG